MAKHSILLVGKNKVMISEFFTHLMDDLECLSCTGRFEDIKNHLKYYKPDALVYCLLEDSFEEMQQIVSARSKLEESNIPLVTIGQREDCDVFSRYCANAVDLSIEKGSLSLGQIATRLNRFLDNKPAAGRQSPSEDHILQEAMRILGMEGTQPVKKHILVIDDNPMMLKVIRESLRDKYEVATAISGKIARKYLANKTVDLILLDYEMPEENGSEVLEKLRQNEATKHIPVIFLTGVKEKAKIQKVLQLKPQGYLLKPIEHDKLVEAINGQLEKN